MKKCNGCPFNDGWTEEATKLQDLGCLPDGHWILREKDENNKNWQCHSRKTVCGGLVEHREVKTGELVSFDYFSPPIDLLEKAKSKL